MFLFAEPIFPLPAPESAGSVSTEGCKQRANIHNIQKDLDTSPGGFVVSNLINYVVLL